MPERSVNEVRLLGRLGSDLEVRYTPTGIPVGRVSLATGRMWKTDSGEMREATDWHHLVLWRCERVAEYLTKGRRLYVAGRIQGRKYTDKAGVERTVTEIVVDHFVLLDGSGRAALSGAAAEEPGGAGSLGVGEEDLPL